MYNAICSVCHEQNNRNGIHQLNMIIRNLKRIIGANECDEKMEEYLMHKFGGRYEMFETGLHCRYGMHCSGLDRIQSEMHHLAQDVPILIVRASLVNASEMYSVLRMMGGYFPRAYRFTENVLHYISFQKHRAIS